MSLPSGKFVLRVDPKLHRSLKDAAHAHEMSLNDWIVKTLSGGTIDQGSKLVSAIRDKFNTDLEGIIVFGSSVRGEMREGSDIDLLMVLAASKLVDRSLYRIWDEEVAQSIGEVYSPQFSHLPDPSAVSSLWLEVALEGEILYDKNSLLKNAIRRIREKIAEGRYIRKSSHGHPYWIRKEEP